MPIMLRILVTAAVVALAAPVRAQTGFVAEYPPVQSAEAARQREWLVGSRKVDMLAASLNRYIRMPRQVALRMVECTASDFRWNAQERAVEMCYRMLTRIYGIAAGDSILGRAADGAHLYLTLHGVAHAIVDELDLPTTDGEEAAVDDVLVLLVANMWDPLPFYMVSGITTLQRADPRWNEWAYATAHGITAERLRNLACLVDGMRDGDRGLRAAGLADPAAGRRCRTAALRLVDVYGRRLGRYLR
jgi:Putative metallopeptidase